jgi:hypothetical protein
MVRGGTVGAATDAYFFLFGLALLPSQVLLAGVMYPLLLNQGGLLRKQAVRLRLGSAVAAGLAVLVGYVVLVAVGRAQSGLVPLAVLLAINGVVSAVLWFDALWLAAEARAVWFAGVALPANAFACVTLIYPWDPAELRVGLMVAALLAGNLTLLLFLSLRGLRPGLSSREAMVRARSSGAPWWYVVRSASGYASGSALQGLALSLPASGVTTVSILNRLVGGSTTTIVNASLPRYVYADSTDPGPAYRFVGRLTTPLAVTLVLAAVATTFVSGNGVVYVSLAIAWTLAGFANALVQRLAYRFLAPSSSTLVVVPQAIILMAAGVLARADLLTLPLVLLAFIAVEVVPAMFVAALLRRPSLVGLGLMTLAISAVVAAR